MKKIISLTKALYKNSKNDSGKLKIKSKIFLYVLLAIYLLFVFSSFWGMFITPLSEFGQAQKFIPLIIYIGFVFLIGTSVSYVANVLYFSNDIENILAFPFKPKEIFSAKLITIYLYEFFIATMLLAPGFVAYGYLLNEGVIFYIYSFFIVSLLPVIPIVCIAGVYTVIMQFMKFAKFKNLFKVLTTIVLLVMVMGFQLNMNLNTTDNGEYSGEYILKMCDEYTNKLPYVFKVAVNGFEIENIFSSVISLIWFIILNVIVVFVIIELCNNFYIKGIRYNLNGVESKKNMIKGDFYKHTNKYFSIFKKEIKVLFRNTTFFIQCVLPAFLIPVITIVMSVNSSGEMDVVIGSESDIIKFISGITVIQFFLMMNCASVTGISRDGIDEVNYLKSQPLDFCRVISAKVIPGILLGVINIAISIIFITRNFEFDIYSLVSMFIIGFLINIIQNYLQIMIDLKHPKLYWESEMSVVKQNINIFYSMLISFVMLIILSIVGGVFAEYNIGRIEIFVIILLLSLYAFIKYYLKKNAGILYKNLK